MSQEALQHALQLLDAGRPEGVPVIRQLASSGNPHALFALARLTWTGNMVPQDPVQGRLLFEYAAARGHSYANLFVTNLLASGVAGRRDWFTAIERLDAEARKLPERRAALDLIQAMDLDRSGDPVSVPEAERLSDKPDLRIVRQLMTPDECAYLIRTAEPLFRPSMVYNNEGVEVRDTIRTSDGAGFYWLAEDPAIHALNRRIASATGTAYDQGEPLQVLRYYPGQEYRPHFDYLQGAGNPRPWTALLYLNAEYEGGATRFVKTGQEVRGGTGDLLIFGNSDGRGARDPLAEHAGMPVTAGTKYLATRWIRERRHIP
jgi:prolyl 4-hydroxylase